MRTPLQFKAVWGILLRPLEVYENCKLEEDEEKYLGSMRAIRFFQITVRLKFLEWVLKVTLELYLIFAVSQMKNNGI